VGRELAEACGHPGQTEPHPRKFVLFAQVSVIPSKGGKGPSDGIEKEQGC
tara:strand:+ start:253 stop:402 length:150 start_codon:yes stop_codon:yes gene_type:complete